MPRPNHLRLQDMREACSTVANITSRGREAFDADEAVPLALARLLEIIGEAANHVSDEGRRVHPGVPWADVTRMRIRLAHLYHRVDLDQIWSISTTSVPRLAEALGPVQG